MNNMVVEARRTGYATGLYEEGLKEVERSCFIDANAMEKIKRPSEREIGQKMGLNVIQF